MLKSAVTKALWGLIMIFIVAGCAKKQPNYGYAPQFTLPDVDGKQVSLADFKGKVLIVNFWATWCPGCVAEMPHFIELYDKYKQQGFEMIGLSLDEGGAEDVKPFLKKKPVNYTMLIANMDVANRYKTKGILPTTFVIDKTGKIRRKYVGARKKAVFEADIKTMLSESIESLRAASDKEAI